MDMESVTMPSWETMSIDMGLIIEPKTDNIWGRRKGRMDKYRRGKRKREKNYMPHRKTLSVIIIK
jgi:hypothetical protein